MLQTVGMLNGAMLTLMISIGHRAGLFDAMAKLPPSTSPEIAEAAGLNERYVREWLAAMTAGRIVEFDAGARTYSLPPEHAASLTRAAGRRNLATIAQFVPLFGNVEDDLVESFREGGGVPYERYEKFHQLMGTESAKAIDSLLLKEVLPLVEGLPQRLADGIDVLDVGCGTGHAINVMADAFPNSRFTGYDFSEEAVAAAAGEAKHLGLSNARFAVQDVARMDERDAFDLITAFDAIHDQAQPAQVLRNIANALRPGGVFLMVDIAASSDLADNLSNPLAPLQYSISTMHCMTVSLALGGAGLGTMWGEQLAREMLADAGFSSVNMKRIDRDIMNAYYIARKD
ncbi:MAG TPA: class I SAM-dependent methyltransferase [Dehalococcoidia bacterium]